MQACQQPAHVARHRLHSAVLAFTTSQPLLLCKHAPSAIAWPPLRPKLPASHSKALRWDPGCRPANRSTGTQAAGQPTAPRLHRHAAHRRHQLVVAHVLHRPVLRAAKVGQQQHLRGAEP